MRAILLIILALQLFFALVTAQKRKITGTIYFKEKPLAGAMISIKDTNVSTVSNKHGRYSITVPEGKETLIFTAPELKVQEVIIGKDNSFTIW